MDGKLQRGEIALHKFSNVQIKFSTLFRYIKIDAFRNGPKMRREILFIQWLNAFTSCSRISRLKLKIKIHYILCVFFLSMFLFALKGRQPDSKMLTFAIAIHAFELILHVKNDFFLVQPVRRSFVRVCQPLKMCIGPVRICKIVEKCILIGKKNRTKWNAFNRHKNQKNEMKWKKNSQAINVVICNCN